MVVTVRALDDLRGGHQSLEALEHSSKGGVEKLSSKAAEFAIISVFLVV